MKQKSQNFCVIEALNEPRKQGGKQQKEKPTWLTKMNMAGIEEYPLNA